MYSCNYIFIFAFNGHLGIDFRNSMSRVGIVCRRNGIYNFRNSSPRLFLDKMSDVIFLRRHNLYGSMTTSTHGQKKNILNAFG